VALVHPVALVHSVPGRAPFVRGAYLRWSPFLA
jgi:hypothetical protein